MENKRDSGFYFMILGLIIGIFSISFFISYDNANKESVTRIFKKENVVQYKILSESKLTKVEDLIKKTDKDTAILLKNTILLDEVYCNCLGINSKGFELYNLKEDKDSISIGKGIKNKVYKKDDKEYTVNNYINDNAFAYSIVMNIDDFIKDNRESNFLTIETTFISNDLKKEKILKDIKSLDIKGVMNQELKIDEIKSEETEANKGELYIALIIFVVSFINVCSFSLMWITGRTKEMALYKAVGAKNTSIFILLFKEIIEFSLISMIIAFVLQYGVNYFVNNNEVKKIFYLWIKYYSVNSIFRFSNNAYW